MRGAAAYLDPGRTELCKTDRVVRRRLQRIGEVAPDLALRDVERRDAIDVADMVTAELQMHQPGDRVAAFGAAVELDPLDQRRGAITRPDDRDPDFRHPNLLDISHLACTTKRRGGT